MNFGHLLFLLFPLHSDASWIGGLTDCLIQRIWASFPAPTPATSLYSISPPTSPRTKTSSQDSLRYGDEVVLRFQLQSILEADTLQEAASGLFLDVWEANPRFVDIRLLKDLIPSLLSLLPKSLQQAYTPIIYDLAQATSRSHLSWHNERAESSYRHISPPNLRPMTEGGNVFFRQYQPLAVIHAWMRLLSSLFPSHVRLISLGLSYEGVSYNLLANIVLEGPHGARDLMSCRLHRNIQALRVGLHPSTPPGNSPGARKTIVVCGGSHAREWISTSTVNFVAYKFITGYGRSREMTRLLERFDFIFIPTINPDGYVYSWENDRLWKKTRQTSSLPFCKGIDLDHAYGYQWRKQPEGSSPCSESFGGDAAFESVEARRLVEWIKNETISNHIEISAFLDFHSYSQQVLYPYRYSCTSTPPLLEKLEEVGVGMVKAMRTATGELYSVTSACQAASLPGCCDARPRSQKSGSRNRDDLTTRTNFRGGSVLDHFYHELQVPYAYQIKLRDTGAYGYLLPESNIIPSGMEASKAIEYLSEFLLSNKGVEVKSVLDQSKLSHPRNQRELRGHEWPGEIEGVDENADDKGLMELKKQ